MTWTKHGYIQTWYRYIWVGCIGITVIVRHLEKRATWYRWPRNKASQIWTHEGGGGLRPQLLYFRINWINVYRKLTNVAQNVKKVASKTLRKPKVAENSKSCQNSKKLPKVSKGCRKVAEQLVAKPNAETFFPKFVEICIETPCWCPPRWAPTWRPEPDRNVC